MDEDSSKHFKELLKGLECNRVFAHMHPYDLYRQWLEAVWAMLSIPLDPQGFKATLDRYTYEQGQELGRLFNLYLMAVEELPFRDILGTLFMRLDIKSVASGQFFTGFHIAEMMARMTFDRDSFLETVRERGTVSVCDPAVGSGVMLLAFAKVVHDELGREGTDKLRLYGTDIDVRCVNMSRIQLRMNGLDGFGRMAALLHAMDKQEPAQAELFTEAERIPA
jgi:methylase of polypeptide subunit release factors